MPMVGAIFSNHTTLCAIFAQIFMEFAKIFTDFAQISIDFAWILTKSKLFGVRLHPHLLHTVVQYSQSDLRIVSKCFNFHLMLIATLSYTKFDIIQLQQEGSAATSNVSRKMLFILQVLVE